MRLLLPIVALALAAGCVTPPPNDGSGDGGGADGLAFAADCAIGPGVAGWPDPCTARASPNESPSKSEIDLAVNPIDPLHVFVASKDLDTAASDCVWAVGQVTRDGGETWKTTYVAGTRDAREPLLAPFACITDPIMVFDKEGTLYYALQAYRLGVGPDDIPSLPVIGQPIFGSTFILARSSDGGDTFDHYVLQHAAEGVGVFHDYPRMLLNPKSGSIHTIWNGVGSAGVTPWVSTSRDGGETVDAPVTFAGEDAPRSTSFESGFAATSDGQIFVTTVKFPTEALALAGDGGNETDVTLFTSTDDARSFQEVGKMFTVTLAPRQIEGHEFRTPSFIEMAIDNSGGARNDRMYAFWPDYATGDSDILTAWSDDKGATWSAPARVHENTTDDQFMMRPKVGPDGTVHVTFYTQEYDPEGKLLDHVHAWSADGGATWQSRRLTESSFDGDKGVHQNGFPFIGDYNGLDVASDGTVYAAWGDTRTGVAEIAFARIRPQE